MFGPRLWLRPDLWLRPCRQLSGLRADDRLFPCSFVNVRRRRRRRGPRCRRGFDNATADAERLEEALDADLRALRFRFCRCFGEAFCTAFPLGDSPFFVLDAFRFGDAGTRSLALPINAGESGLAMASTTCAAPRLNQDC